MRSDLVVLPEPNIDSGAKEESVKKDFTRQSARLQESGIVHCYNSEVWIIYEEDRQDI
jgi:hypothetical protein